MPRTVSLCQRSMRVLRVECAHEQAASPCADICRKISRRLYKNPPKYAIVARFYVPCDSDNPVEAQGKTRRLNCAIVCAIVAVRPRNSKLNNSQPHPRTRAQKVRSQLTFAAVC